MKGLGGKYIVSKSSGEPVDPEAKYFVLRLDTDPVARHAARVYARDIEAKNPRLARDLRESRERRKHDQARQRELSPPRLPHR